MHSTTNNRGLHPPVVSVAPMLDLTDRHCRALLRLLSKRVRLYTEMVVTGSVIYGDRDRFLGFSAVEHPVALQLGGSDPQQLKQCAELAEQYGYDEINLNVGCPSDRVKKGMFGACLMAYPDLVAECVGEMVAAVSVPVTVKTRIGIDNHDSYEALHRFVNLSAGAGCQHFIVHARKAWLKGLSPKQNRSVPPLHYDTVYRLKRDFPEVGFTLNGGVVSLSQAHDHLKIVDGVMIGRQAYHDPWMLCGVDSAIYGDPDHCLPATREEVVKQYLPYIEEQLSRGVYLRHMTRHMLQLFLGQPGARSWRRHLSEYGPRKGAGLEVVEQALAFVSHDKSPVSLSPRSHTTSTPAALVPAT